MEDSVASSLLVILASSIMVDFIECQTGTNIGLNSFEFMLMEQVSLHYRIRV